MCYTYILTQKLSIYAMHEPDYPSCMGEGVGFKSNRNVHLGSKLPPVKVRVEA